MSEEAFLAAAMGMRSKLYHVAMSILWNEQDAADAMQEAMLKGWKRRATLRDEALFEAWFTRILVNQCRDLQRRLIRRRRLNDQLRAEAPPPGPPEGGMALLEAVHRLPDKLRLPVLLYYFEGYSQREIAGIVGATAEQVKTRVRQGRDKLRGMLTDRATPWERGGGDRG